LATRAQFRRGLDLLEGGAITDITFREKEFSKMKKVLKPRGRKFEPPYKVLGRKSVDAELADLLGHAREKETYIILFVPPLPKYFYKGLKAAVKTASRQAELLEENLGVRVWKPDAPWENNLFFDEAHLNFKGRERFVSEFKTWLKGRLKTGV